MAILKNIKQKILNKSDMYNFYKEGYEHYKSGYEKLLVSESAQNDNIALNRRLSSKMGDLIDHYDDLENEITALKSVIDSKDNDLDIKDFNIDKLSVDLDLKDFEIHNLKKEITDKNSIINSQDKNIKKLSFPYDNFEKYLAESYIFPLVWSPFSDESKRCFAFMESVAEYFISKIELIDKKPLISVIMPVYNRKDVVMKAIDSVLNQTYENFELIVVDDASTDGTTELLKEINNDHVRVIFHEKNKYASGARNTGLKAAKGEFVAYLDSDNLLDERYLAATVGAFLEFPDAGGIYSAQYRYETYDSEPFAVQFAALNKSLLHNHNFVDMNCFAHRRSVYDEIGGFDETLKGADDWELILRISNNFKIYSVPFLLSKCYVGVVENRVSDLVPTDMKKIRSQNEVLPTKASFLNKKVNIIIPIYESADNLRESINYILDLNLDNLKIIISNNCSTIDLSGEYYNFNDNVVLIQSSTDYGFTHAVNEGINLADADADILLLSKDAIVTEGAIESLQKHAYDLLDCGLVVSQQVLPNGSLINKHIPYAHGDYWCDITPSKYRKNIINVPLFHNGEVLELNMAPFFCTYIKRDVLDMYGYLDYNLGRHFHSLVLLSEFVRHILKLNIYHISEAIVISNIDEQIRNSNPIDEYDYNYKKNIWDEKSFVKNELKKYVWDF